MKHSTLTRELQLLSDGIAYGWREKLLKKQLRQLSQFRSTVSISVGEVLAKAFPNAKIDPSLDILSFQIDYTLLGPIPIKGCINSEELRESCEPFPEMVFWRPGQEEI